MAVSRVMGQGSELHASLNCKMALEAIPQKGHVHAV
jgi:hypothetical protein